MKKLGILFMMGLLVTLMMVSLVSCQKKAETPAEVTPVAEVKESTKSKC